MCLTTWDPACLISILREVCPGLKVLALHVREEALAAGADGFVGKGEGPEQIVRALRAPCGLA